MAFRHTGSILLTIVTLFTLLSICSAKTFVDFNNNDVIDFGDVINVAHMIVGKTKPESSADFNGNGRVDIGDLARFVYYIHGKTHKLTSKLKLDYNIKYIVYVKNVVDGDTIDVILPNGTEERVRLLGIDTPETKVDRNKPYEYDDITDLECLTNWGIKAKEFAKKLLEKRYVYIEFDPIAGFRGYYGRLLAYVYLENRTDFNKMLVEMGYARVYTEGDCLKENEYLQSQNIAIDNNLGLWTCRQGLTPSSVVIWFVHYDADVST